MSRSQLLFAIVVAALLPTRAFGQTVGTATGSVIGTVRDITGAVLPKVEITVSGSPLMAPRPTLTNAAGEYQVPALPPGDYTLSFSLPGFKTLAHTVRVGLGFTANVEVTLTLVSREEISVTARASVLDPRSAAIAETFDARQLADLPNSRGAAGVIALAHALQVGSFEVGGSAGPSSGTSSAYGRGSNPRHTIEGIVVTGLFGAGFTLDYGSFEEASVLAAAHGAEWPTAGIHTQFVTKSGGNQYRGTLFAGIEPRSWQSFNVDADQIRRVAPSGGGLSERDANRLWHYHDVNADAGGFVVKDRLWWYSSIRTQEISSRLVNFPVEPYPTTLFNAGGKATYRIGAGHTLVAYGQRGHNHQPFRLDPFGPAGSSLAGETAINQTIDSTADQRNSGWIWKAEWNSIVDEALLVEARAGQFAWELDWKGRTTSPRFEDVETLIVSGGNRDWHQSSRRNQFFGTVSYFKNNWFGNHHLKLGGDAIRTVASESFAGYPGDVVHVLESGQPSSVVVFETPSQSEGGLWSYSAYVTDAWRLKNRLTLNVGVRFDRYRSFLPAQAHAAKEREPLQFAAVDTLIAWNSVAPRIAAVYDLTGKSRTLAKLTFGRYVASPMLAVAFNANPNATFWWSQYDWGDADGSGVWEPGEQGLRRGRRGGVAVESVDPTLRLPVQHEAGAWIEHELPAGIGLRTGAVWRHERHQFARQNLNRPFEGFTIPVALRDPGADGKVGTVDDGPTLTAYDLGPDFVGQPVVNILRNIPGSSSEYWTWDISAARRIRGRWSLGAGFTHTWNRDHASGYSGQSLRNNTYPLTPNDLINAGESGRYEFTTWTAKAHGTYQAPWGVRVSPVVRHQSGQPFGRTFTTDSSQLRYATTVTVLAEPVGSRRMDNITMVDVRVEKQLTLGAHRLAGFIDVFNCFDANPELNMIWSSGPSFRRPLTIVSPRIAMVGLKVDW